MVQKNTDSMSVLDEIRYVYNQCGIIAHDFNISEEKVWQLVERVRLETEKTRIEALEVIWRHFLADNFYKFIK